MAVSSTLFVRGSQVRLKDSAKQANRNHLGTGARGIMPFVTASVDASVMAQHVGWLWRPAPDSLSNLVSTVPVSSALYDMSYMMMTLTRKDRAQGAMMGSLVGDALGLGCHWYYDTDALTRDCGKWVEDYRDSLPERTDRFGYIAKWRYDQDVRAGDASQTGQVAVTLWESYAAQGVFDKDDICTRLDEFLAPLDGTELSGRYSDRAVRETWAHRSQGIPWGEAGSSTDTAEAAIWNVVHAAHGDGDMQTLAVDTHLCVNLTHNSSYITGCSTAFVLAVGALINGVGLDAIRKHMSSLRNDPDISARTCSNDVMFQVGNEAAVMGARPDLTIDPIVACRLIGMNCTMSFQVPAAYFLLHRFADNFEQGVLTAVNAGGNNMVRGALTGALLGAHVGLQGIPPRLIEGLSDHEHLLELSDRITG